MGRRTTRKKVQVDDENGVICKILSILSTRKKAQSSFGPFLDNFLMTSPFSTNPSKQDFMKVLKREFRLTDMKDYEK